MSNDAVYLDSSATMLLLPEVKQAMISAMDLVGNPSALHTPGHIASNAIADARAKIAKLIGADSSEIIFTSGGSEANNTVINIFSGQKIAVSAIEHPSILEPAKAHCKAVILPVKSDGTVIFSDHSPSLVSVMFANNELGTINDIKKLARRAHKNGALFHTDATQALGKIDINVKDLDVDYMTISAHKIGGPVGVGALYVKSGAPFTPFILGGHQEHGRRAGTSQLINIVGFGKAAEVIMIENTSKIFEKSIRPLRDYLAKEILEKVPYSSINTPLNNALPHILNCSFEAAEGESIQLYLDLEGNVQVSTGSACAAGDGKPSHVIMATLGDAEIAHSSIRFSLNKDTTKKDIDHTIRHLVQIITRLQGISTIKTKEAK